MKPFLFCPSCGTRLPDTDGEGGATCGSCGRTWYRNSAPTAGGVIVRDGKALVTVRGIEPLKGKFDVPGGFLAAGEPPIEGLKRELREELGLEVEVDEEDLLQAAIHTYGDEGDHVLALGYLVDCPDGTPVAADDVAELHWVTIDELDGLDFAWDHDRELVRKALTLRGGHDG